MKLYLTSLLLSIFVLPAIAQPGNKVFTVSSGTYLELSTPTVVTTAGWDDFDAKIPLGFNFTLLGQSTDTVFFDQNISDGSLITLKSIPQTTHLMGFGADLVDRSSIPGLPLSTIGYQTDVVGGKKITKIEWKDVGFFGEYNQLGSLKDSASFQIWLYEGSNDYEVHYGGYDIATPYDMIFDSRLPTFGIVTKLDPMSASADSVFYVSVNNLLYIDSISFDDYLNSPVDLGFDVYPTSGTIFRFSDPVAGIDGISLNDHIAVYPTWVDNDVTLTISDPAFKGKFSLLDMTGKELINRNVQYGKQNFDLSGLSAGNYIIRIADQKEKVYYKISKNR